MFFFYTGSLGLFCSISGMVILNSGIHLASFAVYPVYTDLSIAITGTVAKWSHVGDIKVLVGSNGAKLLQAQIIWSIPSELGH